MLKNGQTYFKNLTMFTPQKYIGHFQQGLTLFEIKYTNRKCYFFLNFSAGGWIYISAVKQKYSKNKVSKSSFIKILYSRP